jgi:hypothetical protein
MRQSSQFTEDLEELLLTKFDFKEGPLDVKILFVIASSIINSNMSAPTGVTKTSSDKAETVC